MNRGPRARRTAQVNASVAGSVEIQDPLQRCFVQFETACVLACCGIDAIEADVAGVTEWAGKLAPRPSLGDRGQLLPRPCADLHRAMTNGTARVNLRVSRGHLHVPTAFTDASTRSASMAPCSMVLR